MAGDIQALESQLSELRDQVRSLEVDGNAIGESF
jgi:hypothetical protein